MKLLLTIVGASDGGHVPTNTHARQCPPRRYPNSGSSQKGNGEQSYGEDSVKRYGPRKNRDGPSSWRFRIRRIDRGPLQLARQKISLDCFIPNYSIRWSTSPSVLIMIVPAKGRRRGESSGPVVPAPRNPGLVFFSAQSGKRERRRKEKKPRRPARDGG